MLCAATILSSGIVGWSTNHFEPTSPFSSPIWKLKIIERAGAGSVAKRSAISSSTTVPEPSSSAPLFTVSGRAGRTARALAISALIWAHCSGVTVATRSLAPCGRMIRLKARRESCSGGLPATMPTWSVCAPIRTYSSLSFGSDPGSIAITLRPGVFDIVHSLTHFPLTLFPAVPTFSCASGPPSSPSAAAIEMLAAGTPTMSPGLLGLSAIRSVKAVIRCASLMASSPATRTPMAPAFWAR